MQLNHDQFSRHPYTLRRRWGPMLAGLATSTHFDWEELETLCFVFHKLTRGGRKMRRRDFMDIMSGGLDMTDYLNADYSYKNFDPNNNAFISMEEWCKAMSVVLRGTLEERIEYCYKTFDRYNDKEEILKRKNMVWMVSESWCAVPEPDYQMQVKELLETVLSSVASDPEQGITKRDYTKAVKKYPMLLQFLGEAMPSRPAANTFMMAMMPQARAHTFCPEHRTERERMYRPHASLETVSRLGGLQVQPRQGRDSVSVRSLTVPDL